MSDDERSFKRRAVLGSPEVRCLIDRFEEALFAGENPRIEDAVPTDLPKRSILLEELIHVEIECRAKRNENSSLAEYLRRFPELAADPDCPTRLEETVLQYLPTAARAADTALVLRYFGDYELLHEIARGGMGVVYKARQKTLNRIVAVKMILGGKLAGLEDVQRFQIEAEAAAQLDHPGIVPIYEIGEQEGQHFFSMGFVDGQSLAKRVAEGPLDPKSAAEMVKSVAEAVQYAHDKGVLHRDLKPGNILLDRDGKPRVSDFGLAKLTESGSDLTGTGQILGTPSYMPPEQAAAGVTDARPSCDVYSLGAILYCLLTGRPPFQAASPLETLIQVQKQEPVPARQLNRDIPLDLETIAQKCLQKSPAARYQSADELRDDLMRFCEGRPILARPVGRTERFWRWCRREPVAAGLAAALAVFLISVTIGSLIAAGSFRAISKTAREAEIAAGKTTLETRRELARALISEARMIRHGQRVGRSSLAIVKICDAREIYRDLERQGERIEPQAWAELRDEAAGALLVPDLTLAHRWNLGSGPESAAIDVVHDRYVCFEAPSRVVPVRHIGDDRVLFTIEGPGEIVFQDAGFSRCGRHLWLRSTPDDRIHLWKVDENEPLYLRSFPSGRREVLSDDGEILAVTREPSQTEFFRVADGALVNQTTIGPLPRFGNALHPSRPWAALVINGNLRIFDFRALLVVWETSLAGDTIRNASWSQDGRWLTLSTDQARIATFAGESGEPMHAPFLDNDHAGVDPVPLASHNMFALISWSDALKLYDVRTGRLLLTASISGRFPEDPLARMADTTRFQVHTDSDDFQLLQPHRGRVVEFARNASYVPIVSRSGHIVAVGHGDGTPIHIYHIPSGEHLASLPADFGVVPLAFEPHDRALLTYGGGLFRIPIETTGPPENRIRLGRVQKIIEYSTRDQWGADLDCETLSAPNYSNGAVIYKKLPGDQSHWTGIRTPPQRDVRYTRMSPDGKWVVAGSHGPGSVAAYSATTGELVKEFPHAARDGFFSPDGKWLAADNLLISVDDWNIRGTLPGRFHAAFSPDSRLIAVPDGMSRIAVLEAATLRRIANLEITDETHVFPLFFTPDGTGLVAMTGEARRLLCFDLAGLRKDLKALELDWVWPTFHSQDSTQSESATIPRVELAESAFRNGDRPDKLRQLSLSSVRSWRERAVELVRSDDAAGAAMAFGRAFELNSDDIYLGRWWATMQLDAGDIGEYRRICKLLRHRFGASQRQNILINLAWTLMPAPGSAEDNDDLVALATRLVEIESEAPWNQTALAAAYIRTGRFEPALQTLDRADRLALAIDWQSRTGNDFLRGIALIRLGRLAEARPVIDLAGKFCDDHLRRTLQAPFGDWPTDEYGDWYTIKFFRREAEELLRESEP